jgi:hypothetical protein
MRSTLAAVAAAVAIALVGTWPAAPPSSAHVVRTFAPSGPKSVKHHPLAVALAGDVLYVLEMPDNGSDPSRIETYSLEGKRLRTWSVPALEVQGLAVDAAGSAYVTSFDSRDVLKFSSAGRLVARWPAPAARSSEDYPGSIAVDGDGRILVVINGSRIELFDADGRYLATSQVALGAIPGSGLAVGSTGTVYIANEHGISSIDPATGALRTIVAGVRLRGVSRGWGVAAGPAGSVYAIHPRRIEKYGAAGEYLGSVGGHRRADWLNAVVAPDGSIFIPQFLLGTDSVVLEQAPITGVDDMRPSIVVRSIASPPRGSPARTRVLARMRYALSEPAGFRVSLKRRVRTSSGPRFMYVGTLDIDTSAAGTHELELDWRAFGYSRARLGETYSVTLLAQDDAGNESRFATAAFSVAPR